MRGTTAVTDKRTVRTTIEPDNELLVDDNEYTDLERLGLLVTTKTEAKELRKQADAASKES